MKRTLLFIMPLVLLVVACSDDTGNTPSPVKLQDKNVRIEFFTDKDFSGPEYDNHFVRFQAGVQKVTLSPYETLEVLNESSEWIAFRDLPKLDKPLLYTITVQQVNEVTQRVNIGYSYQVKIGETIQMRAANVFMQPGETEKTVTVRF